MSVNFSLLIKYIVPITGRHVADEENDEEESLDGFEIQEAPLSPGPSLQLIPEPHSVPGPASAPPSKPPLRPHPENQSNKKGWLRFDNRVVLGSPPAPARRKKTHQVAPSKLLLDFAKVSEKSNSSSSFASSSNQTERSNSYMSAQSVVLDIDGLISKLPVQGATLSLTKKAHFQ